MGDNKSHSSSRWDRLFNQGKNNYYLKDDTLRDGSKEAINAYNNGSYGKKHPITQQDREDFAEYNTSDPSHRTEQAKQDAESGMETAASGASKYEIERAKFWDEQTMAARKKAEELLNSQPDYTIPEAITGKGGYLEMMTNIGNLLGNITPGGKSGYTLTTPTAKNYRGYGDVAPTGKMAEYIDAMSSFSAAAGNKQPEQNTRDHRRFS